MLRRCLLLLTATMCTAHLHAADHLFDDFSDEDMDSGWDESFLSDDLPVVLTASRLKQPKAEVPASVTVITQEQIQQWGVRTLPEVMMFVPGMLVGHADNENNRSVTYHTSNPNIMRRMQVLIDGRSVYKAAIATVIWDDIPLALEDIARIEITRGPNAALYGANSYLGVINIVTKHPADSLGTTVSVLEGNKGIQSAYIKHGVEFDNTSFRISATLNADEGFDGLKEFSDSEGNTYDKTTESDELRDGRRHRFVNTYLSHQVDDANIIDLQAGYKTGTTEMRQIDFDTTQPDKMTSKGYLYGKWQTEISHDHQSYLQVYWQKEERDQDKDVCAPTLTLDDDMAKLYRINSQWANQLAAVPSEYVNPDSDFTPAELEGLIAGLSAGAFTPEAFEGATQISLNQAELDLTKTILEKAGDPALIFSETVCGNANTDLAEQRIDVEWQDTIRWSDSLRTVSGISFRQDAAYSKTYFNGNVSNDTWRAFGNAEFRASDWLIMNAGGMYEYETHNDAAFSPRVASNFLLGSQHSIRLVASQAVRSPDLLESQPEYRIKVTNIDDSTNYLNTSTAVFFQQNIVEEDEKALSQEKITSYELGYFVAGSLYDIKTEFDLKVFREELRDLISDPITIQATNITNDNEADVNGAEIQLDSQFTERNKIWLSYAYTNVHSRYEGNILQGNDIVKAEKFERRLSSKNNLAVSLIHQGNDWYTSLSYFYQDARHISSMYERWQWNVAKTFHVYGVDTEVSYFIQHNRQPNMPLNYSSQLYNSPNIYYGQVKLSF